MGNKIKLMVYFIAKFFGIFSLMRRLSANKIRILCYHGGSIGDEWKYNGKLFLTKKTFEKRIAWLRANGYHIISLSEAAALSKSKEKRPPLSTVLTFDDGWYSTGHELLTVLIKHQLPATLYLCTKYFEDGWPILDVTTRYIVWKRGSQKIEILGFSDNVDGSYDLQDTSSRELLISKAMDSLVRGIQTREQAITKLNHLAECVGCVPEDIDLNSRRFDFLSVEELREFSAKGCAIELHGHVHCYPAGNPELFSQDLVTCRDIITKLGLPEPKHYCYPSGNFDSLAAEVMKKQGVDSATTCVVGLIDSPSGVDHYYLPRFLDGETVHMLEFEAEMSGFSDFLRRAVRFFQSGRE